MVAFALSNGLEHLLSPELDDQFGGFRKLLGGRLSAFITDERTRDDGDLSGESLAFLGGAGELTLRFVDARLELGLPVYEKSAEGDETDEKRLKRRTSELRISRFFFPSATLTSASVSSSWRRRFLSASICCSSCFSTSRFDGWKFWTSNLLHSMPHS